MLLLSALVWWIDPSELHAAVRQADPALLLLAFGMVTLNRIGMAVKRGLRERVFIGALGFVGVADSLGFAIGLVNHLLFFLAVRPGSVPYLLDPGARERRRAAPSVASAIAP